MLQVVRDVLRRPQRSVLVGELDELAVHELVEQPSIFVGVDLYRLALTILVEVGDDAEIDVGVRAEPVLDHDGIDTRTDSLLVRLNCCRSSGVELCDDLRLVLLDEPLFQGIHENSWAVVGTPFAQLERGKC